MRLSRVRGGSNHLAVQGLELGCAIAEGDKLGGAQPGEVLWVEEQHHPLASEIREAKLQYRTPKRRRNKRYGVRRQRQLPTSSRTCLISPSTKAGAVNRGAGPPTWVSFSAYTTESKAGLAITAMRRSPAVHSAGRTPRSRIAAAPPRALAVHQLLSRGSPAPTPRLVIKLATPRTQEAILSDVAVGNAHTPSSRCSHTACTWHSSLRWHATISAIITTTAPKLQDETLRGVHHEFPFLCPPGRPSLLVWIWLRRIRPTVAGNPLRVNSERHHACTWQHQSCQLAGVRHWRLRHRGRATIAAHACRFYLR